jgi:hypothetical protein
METALTLGLASLGEMVIEALPAAMAGFAPSPGFRSPVVERSGGAGELASGADLAELRDLPGTSRWGPQADLGRHMPRRLLEAQSRQR